MKVKELVDELSKFDSDLEIEFEFEECVTWLLEPSALFKFTYDEENREVLIFNFRSIGTY